MHDLCSGTASIHAVTQFLEKRNITKTVLYVNIICINKVQRSEATLPC